MPAPFNYNTIKEHVKNRISARAYRDILRYVPRANPTWWSGVKPHDITEVVLVATCMKDVMACSYADIVEALSAKISFFSVGLQHNVKLCRRHCSNWARQYIRRGTAG